MLNVPRSVVDDRQPYFVENGKVLTIKEKAEKEGWGIGSNIVYPHWSCGCWRCNKVTNNSKIQGELNDPRSK